MKGFFFCFLFFFGILIGNVDCQLKYLGNYNEYQLFNVTSTSDPIDLDQLNKISQSFNKKTRSLSNSPNKIKFIIEGQSFDFHDTVAAKQCQYKKAKLCKQCRNLNDCLIECALTGDKCSGTIVNLQQRATNFIFETCSLAKKVNCGNKKTRKSKKIQHHASPTLSQRQQRPVRAQWKSITTTPWRYRTVPVANYHRGFYFQNTKRKVRSLAVIKKINIFEKKAIKESDLLRSEDVGDGVFHLKTENRQKLLDGYDPRLCGKGSKRWLYDPFVKFASGKIIKGDYADKYEFPFVGYLLKRTKTMGTSDSVYRKDIANMNCMDGTVACSQCGFAVIDREWILTAAHCVAGNIYDPNSVLEILLGQADIEPMYSNGFNGSIVIKNLLQYPTVDRQIFVHPWYNPKTNFYDFALINIRNFTLSCRYEIAELLFFCLFQLQLLNIQKL